MAGGFVEGTVLADYRFRRSRRPMPTARLDELLVSAHHDVAGRRAAAVVAEAANVARDLQNPPANEITPTRLADRARAMAAELGPERGRGRAEIEAAGMGAFAGVAQGTDEEPQLITLRYTPADARARCSAWSARP